MTNLQIALSQGWQEYLLMGSLALLVISVAAKAISASARHRAPPQPVADAEPTFSIGAYRNSVLTPNF